MECANKFLLVICFLEKCLSKSANHFWEILQKIKILFLDLSPNQEKLLLITVLVATFSGAGMDEQRTDGDRNTTQL